MKIFMTSDTYLPLVGGAEVHVFELQKRLREMGEQVVLFVTDLRTDPRDGTHPVNRDRWSSKRIPQLLHRMWKLSYGADVYHSHYCHKLAMLTGVIARLRGKPFFITLHGLGILDHPGTPWIYDKAHRFYRWTSLKMATHVISTSEDLATRCRLFIPDDRISVIPNGLDTTAFSESKVTPSTDARLTDADPMILTVRRLVPKNGIQYAVSAMPYVLEAYPRAKLVMIGDGRMHEELVARAERLGVEKACVFLGTVQNSDVPPIAARADVVLFPSTAESTSIACAEMMAMGRKIVASRVGGLIELLGAGEERGWLVKLVPWESCNYDAPELDEKVYKDFAQRIIEALRDPKGTERTVRAKAYAEENLDWAVIVRRTVGVYRSFLPKATDTSRTN